jgi:hypothetical protein
MLSSDFSRFALLLLVFRGGFASHVAETSTGNESGYPVNGCAECVSFVSGIVSASFEPSVILTVESVRGWPKLLENK